VKKEKMSEIEKVTIRQLEESGLGLEHFYKYATGTDIELSEEQRELLETSAVNATYFIREKIFESVMEGAEKVRCMRDVLPSFKMGGAGKDYRFVLHENRNGTLKEIPPTSEYPIPINESYREILFQNKKYGEICQIEDELISDSMFDVIEMRMRDLGERAENTVNTRALDILVGCANNTNISYSPNEPFWSIADSIKWIKMCGYTPDTLVMTPEFEGKLYTDPHWRYDYSGEVGNFRKISIGKKILGLTPWVCSVDSSNGSFGGAGAGAVKAVVMQADKAGAFSFKDDIGLDKFNDPKNDITHVKVRIRFDAECFFGPSIALIST